MKCDSCIHNLVCKYRGQVCEFEKKLEELGESVDFEVGELNMTCKYYLEKRRIAR